MFFSNLLDPKVKNRIYCALFTLLLLTSKVAAEDEVADIDPNRGSSFFDILKDLWDILTWMVA